MSRLQCPKCGYDGSEGFMVGTVDQEWDGTDIDGWFCPECGECCCVEGEDCPPDEFGQQKINGVWTLPQDRR